MPTAACYTQPLVTTGGESNTCPHHNTLSGYSWIVGPDVSSLPRGFRDKSHCAYYYLECKSLRASALSILQDGPYSSRGAIFLLTTPVLGDPKSHADGLPNTLVSRFLDSLISKVPLPPEPNALNNIPGTEPAQPPPVSNSILPLYLPRTSVLLPYVLTYMAGLLSPPSPPFVLYILPSKHFWNLFHSLYSHWHHSHPSHQQSPLGNYKSLLTSLLASVHTSPNALSPLHSALICKCPSGRLSSLCPASAALQLHPFNCMPLP